MSLRPFVLTAAQFDGLGGGYGTPDAVTVLRAGQLAKRKLLLQALLRSTGPDPAVDLLLRAEEADPESVTEVLRHPHLDAWATQARRTGGDTGYLAQVAAAAAVRARLVFRIDVPVTHGAVYLPGLGAAGADGDRVTVTGDRDGEVRVGPVPVGGDGWAAVRTVALEPGFTLLIEDLEPYRDTYQWQPAPRLDGPTAERFAALLRSAWQILTTRHPEHADAMRVLLRAVVPLLPPPDGGSVSAASRNASGSVAVIIPATAEELTLLLLHEFMHMKLDALRDLVDLHDPDPKGRYLAPWRMDPRPIGALLQGVYAHAGVTDYWRLRRLEPGAPPVADVEFAYWRRQNASAVESLASSGELTPEGSRFVERLRRTLTGWEREQVRPDVTARVADMVLAQEVRWKFRNWRPSELELSSVTDAWRTGRPPVPPDPTGLLRAAAEGEPSGIPGIVGLLRAGLMAGNVPDPAARALIGGRYAEAGSRYAGRVIADRGDEDAWVGWAVAVAHDPEAAASVRSRPDLVREVVSADPGIDAVSFARWFGKALRNA
jgi:uncharacterized protein